MRLMSHVFLCILSLIFLLCGINLLCALYVYVFNVFHVFYVLDVSDVFDMFYVFYVIYVLDVLYVLLMP